MIKFFCDVCGKSAVAVDEVSGKLAVVGHDIEKACVRAHLIPAFSEHMDGMTRSGDAHLCVDCALTMVAQLQENLWKFVPKDTPPSPPAEQSPA